MAKDDKIKEYIICLEQDKIMIETHFANMERILNDNPKLDQQREFALLSNFHTLNIQYDQLCKDLVTFLNIFKPEEKEIRLYKTEELVEILEAKVSEF